MNGRLGTWTLVARLFAALLAPAAGHAATITGTVTAAGIGEIADAVVAFLNTGAVVDSDTTDVNGMYTVDVPNGTYDVRVTPPPASGLEPKTLPGHEVNGDGVLDIAIVRTERVTYSGLVTQNGAPQAQVLVSLYDLQGQGIDSSTTNAAGRFSMTVPPGQYRRFLFYTTLPVHPTYQLSVEGIVDLSDSVDESFELGGARRKDIRVLVVDPDGAPVPSARVELHGNAVPFLRFDQVFQTTSRSTDAAGRITFAVYPGGSLRLTGVAPSGSNLGPGSVTVTVVDDMDVTIALTPPVESATYRGTVTTDGIPLAGASVTVCNGVQCFGTQPTGASGAFELSVPEGSYSRSVSYSVSSALPAYPTQWYHLYPLGSALIQGSLTEDFDVQGARRHELDGAVVDPDGQPIPGGALSLSMNLVPFEPFFYGGQYATRATDTAGRFSLSLYPGSGTLRSSGLAARGLVDFLVDVTMGDADRSLGILLQFIVDRKDCLPTPPGGTCSTGPIASPSDPIETAVTSPSDGVARDVVIVEEPIDSSPPDGFRFLTQQISITATPAASAARPFEIQFRFDASRIPPGEDETTLQVFRNDVPVPPCTGVPGIADPAPCVESRELATDGDALLTVLTSAASVWNVGEALPNPFLCHPTRNARGSLCAADAPRNAGASCATEEDCGGASALTMLCDPNDPFAGIRLTLIDAWGPPLVDVGKGATLCDPADTTGRAIGDQATHLRGYALKPAKTRPRQPKLEPVTGIRVENQFHPAHGPLLLDAVALDRLLVPAARSLDHPVPRPARVRLDDHACYRTKISKGAAKFSGDIEVVVDDGSGRPARYEVVKPTRLCVPVARPGKPVLLGDDHLVCYRVKPVAGEPKQQKAPGIFVSDELTTAIVDASTADELCVPSRTGRHDAK